jgi:hypothetical protein
MDIDEEFTSEMSHPSDIAKELFKGFEPITKTEMSKRQVALYTRIIFFSEEAGLPELKIAMENWAKAMMSHERKSRGEFTEGLGGMNAMNKFSSMIGQNMGGGQMNRKY